MNPKPKIGYKRHDAAFKRPAVVHGLVSGKSATHFLTHGGEYGDKWDSIDIPKLRALLSGATSNVFEIDDVHPEFQTAAETGNMALRLKRIGQADVGTKGMIAKIANWKNLNKDGQELTRMFLPDGFERPEFEPRKEAEATIANENSNS